MNYLFTNGRPSFCSPPFVPRNGKPVAVLVSLEDEGEIERMVLAYSPKFQSILQAAKRQIREEGGIKHEDFWQEMEEL